MAYGLIFFGMSKIHKNNAISAACVHVKDHLKQQVLSSQVLFVFIVTEDKSEKSKTSNVLMQEYTVCIWAVSEK